MAQLNVSITVTWSFKDLNLYLISQVQALVRSLCTRRQLKGWGGHMWQSKRRVKHTALWVTVFCMLWFYTKHFYLWTVVGIQVLNAYRKFAYWAAYMYCISLTSLIFFVISALSNFFCCLSHFLHSLILLFSSCTPSLFLSCISCFLSFSLL